AELEFSGVLFFFFQAEDGIRVFHVTGVQTCALPISYCAPIVRHHGADDLPPFVVPLAETDPLSGVVVVNRMRRLSTTAAVERIRSEERRVGEGGDRRRSGGD